MGRRWSLLDGFLLGCPKAADEAIVGVIPHEITLPRVHAEQSVSRLNGLKRGVGRPLGIRRSRAAMAGRRHLSGGAQNAAWVLPAGAGYERGDDVCGVAVEGDPSSVVAHGGPRIGVGGGFLHIA